MARSTLDTARFTTTLGAGSVLALVAFVSMRSGLFTRDAGAEFVRAGFSPMALVDGVIDVPGELPSLEAALRQTIMCWNYEQCAELARAALGEKKDDHK